MPRNFCKQVSKRLSRLTSIVALLAVCFVIFPIPLSSLPTNADSKDLSEAFPCQNSPCGCRSAHQCWTVCCCRTPAERLKWARDHGVTPPSYAVLSESPDSACVASASPRSCCSKHRLAASKATPAKSKPTPSKSKTKHFAIGALVLKCYGLSGDFSTMPWATLTVDAGSALVAEPMISRVIVISSRLVSISLEPAVPPPRPACRFA